MFRYNPSILSGSHCCIGKDLTSGAMIGMVVAVDQVFDWLIEALLQLGLEPLGRIRVDRIRRDDAVPRDKKYRNMESVLKPV